jgi:F0F1-type ATP synthase assembly protein I
MNQAKSIFISLHVLLINLALLHIATISWLEPLTSGWLGVFIIALPNLYFFVWLYMGRAARTSRNMHLIVAGNLLGYAMVLTDVNMQVQPAPGLGYFAVFQFSGLHFLVFGFGQT